MSFEGQSYPKEADWYAPIQPADIEAGNQQPKISFWDGMQGVVDGIWDGYIVRGGTDGSIPISTRFVEAGSEPPVIEMHPAWAHLQPFDDGMISQEEAAARLADHRNRVPDIEEGQLDG